MQENIPQTGKMSPASFKSWLGSWQEWGSLLFLFLTLEIVVLSMEQAQWTTPQPSLTLVLVLAVLTGLLLVKSRLANRLTYLVAILLGAVVTVWQASNLLPSLETTPKVNQLVVTLQSLWQVASMAKPSEDTIHFAIFLVFFTWMFGYLSTWFILRRRNAWAVVTLGAIIILINLSNLPDKYYGFFFLYLLTAMLLVAQTNLARHHNWFKKHGINYPKRGMVPLMASVLCLGLLVTSLAWLTPEIRSNRLETLVNTKMPWRKDIEDYLTNFLAAVPRKQSFLKSDEQRVLSFGDTFDHSGEVQFVITSKEPHYWRTRTYDIYTSLGWTNSQANERLPGQGITSTEAEKLSNRSEITYTVVTSLRTDILLTAGEFISSDIPASVQTLAPPSFDIHLLHPFEERSLPPDVVSLAGSLRAAQATDEGLSLNQLKQLLPEDLMLTSIGDAHSEPTEANYQSLSDSGQLTTIEVTRIQTGAENIITVITPYPLKPNQHYTITASISSATPADLSEAGDDYPRWVTDYYLQLPPTLPERVRQLSETVTEEAKSPYDKVLAIKDYLSQIPYSLEVEAPPQGADGVDHFLFNQQSGNCVYFASAMAVMLRSVGVPARLSIGYLPGEWEATTSSSTIQAKHYHTWTEAYFPDYGWIEFEITPVASGAVGSEELEYLGYLPEEWAVPGDITGDESAGTTGLGTTFPQWLRPALLFSLIGIISLLLLILALKSAVSRWLWRLKGPDYASEVYAKMCSLASLVKLSPKPQETPLEYGAKLASTFPLQAEAIDIIVQTYLESRFSRRKEPGLLQEGRLLKSRRDVYYALLKRLLRRRQ